MRSSILAIFIILTVLQSANAQNKAVVGQNGSSDSTYTDTFKGLIPFEQNSYPAKLLLKHCRYCDDGTFELIESPKTSSLRKLFVYTGEWTVLKGSAADDNATVVELDAPVPVGTLYYLRLKNGDLQQLDSTLHELKPAAKHMLAKQARRHTAEAKPKQTPAK